MLPQARPVLRDLPPDIRDCCDSLVHALDFPILGLSYFHNHFLCIIDAPRQLSRARLQGADVRVCLLKASLQVFDVPPDHLQARSQKSAACTGLPHGAKMHHAARLSLRDQAKPRAPLLPGLTVSDGPAGSQESAQSVSVAHPPTAASQTVSAQS